MQKCFHCLGTAASSSLPLARSHGNGVGTPKRDAAVVSRHHIGVQRVVESPKVVFTSHSDGKVSKDGRIPSISTLQLFGATVGSLNTGPAVLLVTLVLLQHLTCL